MHLMLEDEELKWINKELFNWTIKEGCPDDIRKKLEKKLDLIRSAEKE